MSADREARWLRRFAAAAPGSPRLVCFPHAGGCAGFFQPLLACVAHRFAGFAVQYPGRQDRASERPVADLASVAGPVAELLALRAGPVVLLGHGMGAVVALEAARALADIGPGAPPHVVVSGWPGPADPPATPLDRLSDTAVERVMAALAGDQAWTDVVASVAAVRADHRAVAAHRHQPRPLLSSAVTAVQGVDDPLVPPGALESWRATTTGPFAAHVVPGGHFHLVRPARFARVLGWSGSTGFPGPSPE